MKKEDLIWEAASEGVIVTRMGLHRLLVDKLSFADYSAVDTELHRCEIRAANYAVKAYRADCTKIKNVKQLISELGR